MLKTEIFPIAEIYVPAKRRATLDPVRVRAANVSTRTVPARLGSRPMDGDHLDYHHNHCVLGTLSSGESVPLTRVFAGWALLMAGSVSTPIQPLDGARLSETRAAVGLSIHVRTLTSER